MDMDNTAIIQKYVKDHEDIFLSFFQLHDNNDRDFLLTENDENYLLFLLCRDNNSNGNINEYIKLVKSGDIDENDKSCNELVFLKVNMNA